MGTLTRFVFPFFPSRHLSEFHCDDPGGNGDDGVTGEHGEGCDHLAHDGHRCNIAITDRGDGDNGPIDALGNGGESARFSFNHIHDGAHEEDEHQQDFEKDDDLLKTFPQGRHELVGLDEVAGELQYPENTKQPERPDCQQEIGLFQEQSEIGWKDGDQIDDPHETGDILPRFWVGIDAQQVLNGEDCREKVFHAGKQIREGCP